MTDIQWITWDPYGTAHAAVLREDLWWLADGATVAGSETVRLAEPGAKHCYACLDALGIAEPVVGLSEPPPQSVPEAVREGVREALEAVEVALIGAAPAGSRNRISDALRRVRLARGVY